MWVCAQLQWRSCERCSYYEYLQICTCCCAAATPLKELCTRCFVADMHSLVCCIYALVVLLCCRYALVVCCGNSIRSCARVVTLQICTRCLLRQLHKELCTRCFVADMHSIYCFAAATPLGAVHALFRCRYALDLLFCCGNSNEGVVHALFRCRYALDLLLRQLQ